MGIKTLFIACGLCAAFAPSFAYAQDSVSDATYGDSVFVETRVFDLGRVESVLGESTAQEQGDVTERVNVRVLTGTNKNTDETLEYVMSESAYASQQLSVGDLVILATDGDAGPVITDKLRLPGVALVLVIFFALAIIFAGLRGFTSILGLGASLAILAFGVVPLILHGWDPLLVCLVGSFLIAIVSILLAHGMNRRSGIALLATLGTLVLAIVFSYLAVMLAKLSGYGSEEAIYLQLGSLPTLNLRGLLLGGMIIGTLGVLDDVTTAQVAAVEEIGNANRAFGFSELYRRGLRVGREHIAALVNTLALAYAGASFPLFLLFSIQGGPPLWVVLNAEYVMEEVVRALVGGASLVIAVPISTALAAYGFGLHRR